MNLVFGSKVTLLGFWEYMFGILLTVQWPNTNFWANRAQDKIDGDLSSS